MKDGWKTDRGRVLVKYGHPTQIDKFPFEGAPVLLHEDRVLGLQVYVDLEALGREHTSVGGERPTRPVAVWDAANGELANGPPGTDEIEQKLHATIKKVTEDVASLQYNTAIAAMMEYLNIARAGVREARRSEIEPLVVLIAPFAPHLAEELWVQLGHDGSIFTGDNWPEYDPKLAVADEVDVAVQVNGRLRATISVPRGASEDDVKEKALAEDGVQRHMDGKQIRKVIFVPDRLINIVVG